MTAPHILNPAQLLDNALSGASPDLMRDLLTTVINALLSAEADAVCGAEYGQASPNRTNSRNGYRSRELDRRPDAPAATKAAAREPSSTPPSGHLATDSEVALPVGSKERSAPRGPRQRAAHINRSGGHRFRAIRADGGW